MFIRKYVVITGALLLSTNALAEHGAGNGGNTVVCKDPAGNIQSVELMDLWEGGKDASPEPMGSPLKVSMSVDSVDAQIDRAVRRLQLDPLMDEYLRDELKWTRTQFSPIPNDVSLTEVGDIMPRFTPRPPCDFELLANYFVDGHVEYDSRLRDVLDREPTQEAALQLHESLYKVSRDLTDARDSVPVRKLVAYAFSDSIDTNAIHVVAKEALGNDHHNWIHVDHGVDGKVTIEVDYVPSAPDETGTLHIMIGSSSLDARGNRAAYGNVVDAQMSFDGSKPGTQTLELPITISRLKSESMNIEFMYSADNHYPAQLTPRILLNGKVPPNVRFPNLIPNYTGEQFIVR